MFKAKKKLATGKESATQHGDLMAKEILTEPGVHHGIEIASRTIFPIQEQWWSLEDVCDNLVTSSLTRFEEQWGTQIEFCSQSDLHHIYGFRQSRI
jgi:hypothetical protein